MNVVIADFCLLLPGGAIAQLGERLLCKQEVVGSIPSGSTRWFEDRITDLAEARPVQIVRENITSHLASLRDAGAGFLTS